MSFHEVSVVIRAVNRASNEFSRVSADAENMATRVRSAGAVIAGLGASSRAVAFLGTQFGLLTAEQSKWLSSASYVISALGMFMRTSWGVAIAQKVYAAATVFAAKVTWVFNSALAMKVALLTLGVGLIAVTAAYMAWLASNTREAAEAMSEYNAEASRTAAAGSYATSTRNEELKRRGLEI
jgi:hypothetical protein